MSCKTNVISLHLGGGGAQEMLSCMCCTEPVVILIIHSDMPVDVDSSVCYSLRQIVVLLGGKCHF